MGVRIDEDGALIAGNCALPAPVVPAVEAFFRDRFAAQQPVAGHHKPTDDMQMKALAEDIAMESPKVRTTEVIVGHRLGFWYPVEDPDTLTDAEIAMADDYLEAHIQWRISQSETRITDEMVERFRAGWLKAHDEGDMGNRVRRGLVAALEGEGRMTLAGARRAFTEEEVEAAARAICEDLGGDELNYWLADRHARAALDAVSRIRGEA